MANRKQEFYMSVKAILDKTSVKRDAEELKSLLNDVQIDFDTPEFEEKVRSVIKDVSKETMSVIGQGFNDALKLLGKEQINIENLIQMPNADMWKEMGRVAGKFYAEGLQNAIQEALSSMDLSAIGKGSVATDSTSKLRNEIIEAAKQYSDFQKFQRENIKSLQKIGVKSSKEAGAIWKEARYTSPTPSQMSRDDAVDMLRDRVPENILDGWFRNADSSYKGKLENLALSDKEIRNAALNIMWSNFKEFSGKDIDFEEFLHSEIPVYRGKNSEKYVDGDEILSFSFDEKIAEKFGQHVLKAVIKPIETIGSYQTTAEGEVFVRRDQLEQRPEYQQWHNAMAGIKVETPDVEASQKVAEAEEKAKINAEERVNANKNTTAELEKQQKILNIPSEEDIKGGKASWRGLPIKYDTSLSGEARNLTDYMSVGDKFFTMDEDTQKNILDHEVAHNIADRIMSQTTDEWEKVANLFAPKKLLPKGANPSFYTEEDDEGNKWYREGLYGDLGATALSETLTHALTEYFNDPSAFKKRSEGAFNYLEGYLNKSGDTLDNVSEAAVIKEEADAHKEKITAIKEETQVQKELNSTESQNPQTESEIQKEIKSYEELSNVVSRYIELVKSLVDTENNTPEHKQIQQDLNRVYYSNLPENQEEYIDKINKQQKNISKIKSAIKAGSSTYTDEDGYEERVEGALAEAESKLRAYIYNYVENFNDIGALVDGAKTKGLKNLIEKEVGKFKADEAIQQQQREIAEAANVAALAEMEQIENTIRESASTENRKEVSDTLDEIHYRANKIDRFTQSSQTDWIADNLGIISPHKEIEINAKAINSYEELCEVVARYNELMKKRYVYTGDTEETLDVDEENEFADLKGRLNNTSDGVNVTWKDVDKGAKHLAQVLGIEIPQASQQAEGAINGVEAAQEKLNAAETQNPPVQNEAPVHNANAEAIEKEVAAEGKLAKARKAVRSLWDSSKKFVSSKKITSPQASESIDDVTVPTQTSDGNIDSSAELKAAIENLTKAITTKPEGDVEKSTDTEDLKGILESITYKVALTSDATAPTQQNDGDTKGPWALEDTLSNKTNAILENIKSNTEKKSKSTDDSKLASVIKTLNDTLSKGIVYRESGEGASNDQDDEKLEKLQKLRDGYIELGKLQAKYEVSGNIQAKEQAELLEQKLKAERAKIKSWATSGQTSDLDRAKDKAFKNEKESLLNNAGKQSKLQNNIDTQFDALANLEKELQSTGNLSDELKEKIERLFDTLQKVKTSTDLSKWKEEFGLLGSDFDSLEEAYEELGKLQAQRELNPDGQEKTLDNQIAKTKKLIEAIEKQLGLSNELYEPSRVEAYNKEVEKLNAKQEKEDFKTQVKISRDQNRVSKANSTWRKGDDALRSIWKIEDASVDVAELSEVVKLQEALNNLDEVRTTIAKKGNKIVDPADAAALKTQSMEVDKYTVKLKELIDNYEFFSGENSVDLDATLTPGADVKAELKKAVMAYTDGKAKAIEYDSATQRVTFTVQTGAREFTTYTAGVRGVDQAFRAVKGTVKTVPSLFEQISKKTKEIFTYFSGSSIIYKAVNEVRKGIQYVREIDSALTELKKVTDETEESYERFLDTASKTADKVGSTVKEIISSTADWSRLGYSMEQAHELAASTSVLLNVSEFDSIDSATSALVSTMQAFNYAAKDSMHVVDVMNEIGNNYAVSSDGIATALQESASALSAANNSYQEAVAMIAAANKTTQDVSKVGGALRTISLRLRGTEVEGEDNEGLITSKSKLQGKIKSLSGVDILTDTGAYKSTYQVLLEISKVFNEMNDLDQAALLEIIAGKNRSNVAAGLLSNTKDLEAAYESALDAEGSALRENEKYLDSIQGKIDQFTNAYQTLWNNMLDSSWIKGIVDLGTIIVQIIDKLGLFGTALTAITVTKIIPWLLQVTTSFTSFKAVLSSVGKWMITASGSSKTLGVAIGNLVRVFKAGEMSAEDFASGIVSLVTKTPVVKILAIAAAVFAVIGVIEHFHTSAKEASEQLKKTKENVSSLESELKSLQTQLNETKDKISELVALPHLSLTQQEDLDRLKQETELLERQIALKERQLAIEEKKLIGDTKTAIKKKWTDRGAYDSTNKGVIQEDKWYTWGESGKDVVNTAIKKYEKNKENIRKAEDLLLNWGDDNVKVINTQLADALNIKTNYIGQATREEVKKAVEKTELANIDIASSIENFFNDPDYAGLSYGIDDEIDGFLDEFAQAKLKWEKALYGDASKSNAIKDLFGSNATKEMKYLKNEIDKIMATDDDWEAKNKAIEALIPTQKDIEGYQQLDWAMENLGVTAQDVADYFTVLNGEFNSSTPEGLAMQYKKGIDVLKQMQSSTNFKQDWGEFFTQDDEGKFEARVDKFAEVLEGMDNETRATFIKIVESAANSAEDLSKIDWNKAMSKFTMAGLDSQFKLIDNQFESLNNEMFKDAADDINGLIDTVSELKAALEDVANTMDLVHTAQTQMSHSGQISLKTALELMETTEDWNSILDISTNGIKLKDGAEQILIQTELTAIKTQLEYAYQMAKTRYETALTAQGELDYADNATVVMTAESVKAEAIGRVSAVVVGLGAAIEALNNWENPFSAFSNSYNSAMDAVMVSVNSQKTSISELKNQMDKSKSLMDGYTQISSVSGYENYYDYDKTPGDKYDDTGDALEALQKRYERKIKNLDAQQTQIENDIEILEAEEAGVSASYYEKQIDLEQQKLDLYEDELEALKKLKLTDEVADALWEVEHAIQESTLRMIEFRKSIAELYATASSNLSEAYDNKGQVYDDRKSYIENEISIRETKGELIPTSVYDDLIEQEKLARDNAQAELNDQADLYWQGMNNNQEEFEGSDQAVEILEKIRQKKLEIQESTKAIAEYEEQQKDAYIAYFDAMMEAYSRRNTLIQSQADFGQAYIDRLDILNINVPDSAYEELASIQEMANENLQKQFDFAKSELDNFEAQGIDKNDARYIDKLDETLALEQKLYEGETKVLEYHQQIIENNIDRLNQVVDRINHATSQLENISGLLDGKDVAEKDGSWTAAGLTQLGMLYQQMEYNEQVAAEYADKMQYLDDQLKAGQITEKEYTEQMQELENGQWDAINAYKSAEDAIIDLNEARIDMVEEGIQKEIEAYEELIKLKQDELQSERD